VTVLNLWKLTGLELLINLDQRFPAMRFIRKFWEQYLNAIARGKGSLRAGGGEAVKVDPMPSINQRLVRAQHELKPSNDRDWSGKVYVSKWLNRILYHSQSHHPGMWRT
jgi:hypothetical protein